MKQLIKTQEELETLRSAMYTQLEGFQKLPIKDAEVRQEIKTLKALIKRFLKYEVVE